MRSAFSIIELVVAIVVISLVLMNLPLMLYQSTRLNQVSTTSDMLYGAESSMYGILSHRWDENSEDSNNPYKVLETASGESELQEVNTTNKRVGHIDAQGRRSFHFTGALNASSTLGLDTNDTIFSDDVDDFNSVTFNTTNGGVSVDYVSTFNIQTTVNYINDSASYDSPSLTFTLGTSLAPSTSSIKLITVQATDQRGGDLSLTLRAYRSNIGESTYARKLW